MMTRRSAAIDWSINIDLARFERIFIDETSAHHA
jgi:hypothetical protein